MPVPPKVLIALLLATVFFAACGSVHPSAIDVTPPTSTSVKGLHTSEYKRDPVNTSVSTSVNPLAQVSRVARYVNAVRDAKRVREAAWVIAIANSRVSVLPHEEPTIVIGDASTASGCGGVVGDLLARYFGDDLAWATHTVMRESGCSPGAVNQREGCDTSGRTNSHAAGLWQLCWPLHQGVGAAVGCSDPLDAECNTRIARRLYDEVGRSPWGG